MIPFVMHDLPLSSMKKYRVLVHGTNVTVRRFLVLRRKVGFYTTCYVEARSETDAKDRALDLLRNDPKVIMSSITEPKLQVEELSEIETFEDVLMPRTGLVFYT